MKPLHRILLVVIATLFSAAALPAQRFVSSGGSATFSGGYGFGGGYGGGFGYGSSPFSGWGWGDSFGYSDFGGWGYAGSGLHHPEEHAPFGVAMAHGDADFQPSQYMDYNEALELGKKMLAEEAAPKPSLGEIARALRAKKRVSQIPPAPAP